MNTRPDAINLQVEVKGASTNAATRQRTGTVWLLHTERLSDSNTPSDPTFVSPTMSALEDVSSGIAIPGNSFVIVELSAR